MFAPFTPVEKCIGKEVLVRFSGETYQGMLAGLYQTHGLPVIVLTPMRDGGTEIHIPLSQAVVTIRQS